MRAEFDEAVEIIDGSAVEALGLSLIAEEQRPGVGAVTDHAVETVSKAIGAVLFLDFFGCGIQVFVERDEGRIVSEGEGLIERGGAESGFQAGHAEQVVLREREALDRESFLRIPGLVDGNEVVAEAVDGVAILDFDDGEVDAGEAVLARVLRGADFACGSARAGGVLSVGSVGGELFVSGHRS